MKPITVLFVTFAALVAISMVVDAGGPPMPADMPDNLKTEYDAIHAEVEKLPKNERGHPDFKNMPDELKARMEKLRTDYETATGKEWPRPKGPPPS